MKKLILSIVFSCVCFSMVEAQSVALPNECRKILNKNFRGWKMADIQKDISEYHRKNQFAFQPNLIRGDWNGDGKSDYAVLIDQGKLRNVQRGIIGNRRLIIAFVKIGNELKHFQLDGADSISPLKKGSADYNYETNKKFRYRTDAIFSGFWEKGGSSFIWQKGKFVEIITSD